MRCAHNLIQKYFTNHIALEQVKPNEVCISGLSKTGGIILFWVILVETYVPVLSYLLGLKFEFGLHFYSICALIALIVLFGFRFAIVIDTNRIVFYDTFLLFKVPRIKGSSQEVVIYGRLEPKRTEGNNGVFIKWEDDGGWDSAFESEWLLIRSGEKEINLGNQKTTPEILKQIERSLIKFYSDKYKSFKKR